MQIPLAVRQVLEVFAAQEPLVAVWEKVPDVPEDADNEACETLSSRFTALCRRRGLDAHTICAQDFPFPLTDYHCWTAIRLAPNAWVHVDWTARQFHNLEYPPNPAHADLACPLVWAGAEHPVLGPAGASRVTGVTRHA